MKRNEVWSEFVGQNFLVEWELPPSKSAQIGKKVNEKFRGVPGGEGVVSNFNFLLAIYTSA